MSIAKVELITTDNNGDGATIVKCYMLPDLRMAEGCALEMLGQEFDGRTICLAKLYKADASEDAKGITEWVFDSELEF